MALAGVFIAYVAIYIIAYGGYYVFKSLPIAHFSKATCVQKRPHLPYCTDLDC
jgi:hypothetical protein